MSLVEITDLEVRVDDPERPSAPPRPILHVPQLRITEGDLVLVVGPTGSGKSTLLRCLNGLVPHFTGGEVRGHVVVAGRDTRAHRPRDLADVVGYVGQNPRATFVTDSVEAELAYGLELLGVHPHAMRRRVEETLDLLHLHPLRHRRLEELSGGQQQRVAIGAVLAAGPRLLVLDEPTSALDPVSAEEVLASLHRLVHDVGLTVVLAEHRLERVVHHADGVVLVEGGEASAVLPTAQAMVASPVRPPVVDLGLRLGWSPLPLSIREARRASSELRSRLTNGGDRHAPSAAPAARRSPMRRSTRSTPTPAPAVALEGVSVVRGRHLVLDRLDLALPLPGRRRPGSVTALMGRNGAGKSTVLSTLVGLLDPAEGRVAVLGENPRARQPAGRSRLVGLVPQDATTLLYAQTVAQECADADRQHGRPAGECRALLDRLVPGIPDTTHPRDLSEGQRLALALAVILTARPPVLLLDEPTRGLDYGAKARLVGWLSHLADDGTHIVLATHDVELAAEVADDVVVVADGEVVAQGPTQEVLTGSPAFAPQVAKVMAPVPALTVDAVLARLESPRPPAVTRS